MLVSVALSPIGLNCTPRHSAVTPADREVPADRVALDRPGNHHRLLRSRDVPVDRQPLYENERCVGGGDVPVDGDDGLPVRVVGARHSREPADGIRRLTAQAEE